MRRIPEVAAALLALVCGGCASRLPAAWLPDARELERWPYGAAAAIRTLDRRQVNGELIAIGGDSVHVLTGQGLIGLARRTVASVQLRADRQGRLRTGAQLERLARRSGVRSSREWERQWQALVPFARFPAGLPDSLDRGALVLPPDRPREGPPPGRMEAPRR